MTDEVGLDRNTGGFAALLGSFWDATAGKFFTRRIRCTDDGAALVSDGIVGVEHNCVHGSALDATPVRVRFPAGTKRVLIKPAGTGSMKVAMNAPDTTSETTTAIGAAWLAQANNKNINMMFRRITAGGPVEDAEIVNKDGIECLDFTGDATITSVAFSALVGG